jgi:hypothetical protein
MPSYCFSKIAYEHLNCNTCCGPKLLIYREMNKALELLNEK